MLGHGQRLSLACVAGSGEGVLDDAEKVAVVLLLINCFQSLEEGMVRQVRCSDALGGPHMHAALPTTLRT